MSTNNTKDAPSNDANTRMRLQRYLSRSGVASRRKCEDLILEGRVCVNGCVVKRLGTTVDTSSDVVTFDGMTVQLIPSSGHVVVMLNKPLGYLSAMSDTRSDKVVSSLVPTDKYKGLFPVGRLDRDTSGLLLFTTDGVLGNALMHPSKNVSKRYIASINGHLKASEVSQLEGGVLLTDGMTSPAVCIPGELDSSGHQSVTLEIHEGKNRQVRRMFEALGYKVITLNRVAIGPIVLGSLPLGRYRTLDNSELKALYSACGLK